jgi:DNA-binding SARP family transcriptional activator
MTDFRLLGPLEAVEDGEPLALPVGKPRALLARLLLDAGRVVAVEALVDGLWGDHPPASANKLLQVYVSQLRKVLGRDAIETRRPGYLVRGDGRLDLTQFEALTEAAREGGDPARRS